MNESCMILADKQGKAWDFAYSIYEILNKKNKKFEINEVEIKRFPDGEIKAKIKENVRKSNCFFIHDSSKNPAEWFLELALVNGALKTSSVNEITNVLPYMKFARQDRKDESRVSISSKVVADVIQLYANRVITCELHAPQIQGFYDIPVDNLYTFPASFLTLYPIAISSIPILPARAFALTAPPTSGERTIKFSRKSLCFSFKWSVNVGKV